MLPLTVSVCLSLYLLLRLSPVLPIKQQMILTFIWALIKSYATPALRGREGKRGASSKRLLCVSECVHQTLSVPRQLFLKVCVCARMRPYSHPRCCQKIPLKHSWRVCAERGNTSNRQGILPPEKGFRNGFSPWFMCWSANVRLNYRVLKEARAKKMLSSTAYLPVSPNFAQLAWGFWIQKW